LKSINEQNHITSSEHVTLETNGV